MDCAPQPKPQSSILSLDGAIDAVTYLHQQPLFAHPGKVVSWDTKGGEIAGPDRGPLAQKRMLFLVVKALDRQPAEYVLRGPCRVSAAWETVAGVRGEVVTRSSLLYSARRAIFSKHLADSLKLQNAADLQHISTSRIRWTGGHLIVGRKVATANVARRRLKPCSTSTSRIGCTASSTRLARHQERCEA